jgi:glycosyltransferase involved in cell wall biosynthesis
MKVLILINSFGRGGAEKSTALFIIKLNRQYADINFVCVYLYPFMPGFYKEIEENNIPLIHIKEKNIFSRVKRFRNLIKEYQPDIIHSVLHESNMITRFSSIGSKSVFVESLVSKPYFIDREYPNKIIKYKHTIGIKFIDKWSSFLVNHFHSVGLTVAKFYLEVYNRKFAYTIVRRGRPVPVDVPARVITNSGKLILVTLARHEYLKGLQYLLEAILPIKDRVKLKIVGRDGAATLSLKEFVKKHQMENTVEFCGFLNDVIPVLREADIYVSASLTEGLPGSVIEAMSLKMPLLLSDIEEHREVATENENALFFKSKNIEGIRSNINQILENKIDLISFGNKSFEIFNERFTEDAMVNGMAQFYYNVLKIRN